MPVFHGFHAKPPVPLPKRPKWANLLGNPRGILAIRLLENHHPVDAPGLKVNHLEQTLGSPSWTEEPDRHDVPKRSPLQNARQFAPRPRQWQGQVECHFPNRNGQAGPIQPQGGWVQM